MAHVSGHCFRTPFGNVGAKLEHVTADGADIVKLLSDRDRASLKDQVISKHLNQTHPQGDSAHLAE